MDTVLGIDVGTQSVKALFYEFGARRTVAVGSAPLDLVRASDGVAEQQAVWWIDALSDAVGQADPAVRRSVRALAVSGQQHGFVPVDAVGEVLAPVKLWCDTSTAVESDAIMQDFGGEEACLAELGNLVLPGYTASKIRWLRDARPAEYERLRRIMLPHDYVNFWLTGAHAMEAGDASGTAMLSIAERTWSARMLAAIDAGRDLAECLPEVRIANETIGGLRTVAAGRLGLAPGIPVAIGGNVAPGTLTMSLGTSGTVFAYAEQPVLDPHGAIAAFCSSTGGWLPLLCTLNCTSATEPLRRLLGADIAGFESRLEAAPCGAEGVLVVPFFNGERMPNLPRAKGCIFGLNAQNLSEQNLLRAVVEGVTFGLRYGVEELAGLGVDAQRIVLTGGGARSRGWRQIVADVCRLPVIMYSSDEGAAFGAALQACALIEGESDLDSLTRDHLELDEDKTCEPDSVTARFYDETYQHYRQKVGAVVSLYA